MSLAQFDVSGEEIANEETGEILRQGDPSGRLMRYRPDGGELYIHSRVNMALLRAAVPLPILLIKPVSRDDEVTPPSKLQVPPDARLLTPQGSVRNYRFLENLCQALADAACPACYLAEQHGEGRRDFYFVAEDSAAFERIAHATAGTHAFPLRIERYSLTELAPLILVTEAIGELGLQIAQDARIQTRRFEFWGAAASLEKLRARMEERGYRFLSLQPLLGELYMSKPVAIDGANFLAVLKDIVPLARSLRCSYRGAETIDGAEQFLLTRELPARYAAPAQPNFLGRVFGRKKP
jgi:hypothetical protein